MKNLHLLENCFASDGDRDFGKLEALNSKLIRENARLQKENMQLTLQTEKQELWILHLLKKLELATELAKTQQTGFDDNTRHQTQTISAMLQNIAKSKSEIANLKIELSIERSKNADAQERDELSALKCDCRQYLPLDISDEITVAANNKSDTLHRNCDGLIAAGEGGRCEVRCMSTCRVHGSKRGIAGDADTNGQSYKGMRRFLPDDDTEPLPSRPNSNDNAKVDRGGLREKEFVAPELPSEFLSNDFSGFSRPAIPPDSLQGVAKSNSTTRAFGIAAMSSRTMQNS